MNLPSEYRRVHKGDVISDERLFEFRPFGFRSVVVRGEQDDLWDPSWGELIESRDDSSGHVAAWF